MAKSTESQGRDAAALAALERLRDAPPGNVAAPRTPDTNTAELAFAAPRSVNKPRRPPRSPAIAVPRWYRVAAPVLFSVGGLLVIIGLWAVGAMIYMHTITPSGPDFEVQYPLLRWNADLGDAGAYTPASKMMAAVMLACLPVAGIMGGMLLLMRRQMRIADRQAPPRLNSPRFRSKTVLKQAKPSGQTGTLSDL